MSVSILKKLEYVTSPLDEMKAKVLEQPQIKSELDKGFTFEALHPYYTYDGKLIYLKIRLKNHSTGAKWIRPITYDNEVIRFSDPEFSKLGFNNGKPLYNLEKLANNQNAIVYLVEGEKAADALNHYFKKNGYGCEYVATTSGSATSVNGADFSPLAQRNVVCWADNDECGGKYISQATTCLQELECNVDWVAVENLHLSAGGDAADWLEDNPEATIEDFIALEKIAPNFNEAIEPLFDINDARVAEYLKSPPPPRRYLLDKCLPIGKVGLVVGMGGVRKSMLMMQLQIAIATNMALCGYWGIGEAGASLGLYAEEDEEELHRRLYFATEDFAPNSRKLINENVYIKSMTGICTQLTEKQHSDAEMTEIVDRLILTAKQTPNLKLIILDPASRFRGGDENNSSDATRFVEACELIAKETGATLLIVHHVNKVSISSSDTTQAAARGSSALTDGVRWQMNLSVMSEKEARSYEVPMDRRKHFVKCTVTKNNYAPPQESEVWLEMQGSHGNLQHRQIFSASQHKIEDIYNKVLKKIKENFNIGIQHSSTGFCKEYGGKDGIFKIGEKGLRSIINEAIDSGNLVLKPPIKPQKNVTNVLAIPEGLTGSGLKYEGLM